MNFRKGDHVSIVGIVKHNVEAGEKIFVELPGYHSDIWVSPDVLTLVQAHFDVGDKCQWADITGIILAISDGHAWIDRGGGDYCTRLLMTIERVDSDEE